MVFVLSAILSALIGVVISALVTRYKDRVRWRHVRDLLNFGDADVLFVIPHRELEADSIMPRVAAEDVLAMMNVMSLITRAGLHVHFKVKDTKNLSDDDRKKNIITIGGAKVNEYTDWILNKVTATSVHFERDSSDNKFILKRRHDTTYVSPSHRVPDGTPVEAPREDVAFLFKFRNPKNDAGRTIVVGLAGLRGIGTWAASDCLRKKYRELHRRKSNEGHFVKDGDFIAFISAEYERFDITGTRIIDFEDLS